MRKAVTVPNAGKGAKEVRVGAPQAPEFIDKKLCIYSHMLELQSTS